jgi:hypothetical protein
MAWRGGSRAANRRGTACRGAVQIAHGATSARPEARPREHAGISTADSEPRPLWSARSRGVLRRLLASAGPHRLFTFVGCESREGSGSDSGRFRRRARQRATQPASSSEQVPGRHRTPASPHRSVTVAALNLDGAVASLTSAVRLRDLPHIAREFNLDKQRHEIATRVFCDGVSSK